MGRIHDFPPQKLVIPMILAPDAHHQAVFAGLRERFGPIDYLSDSIPFNFTDYYEPEMGADLVRRFASFEALVDPSTLADIKLETDALERRFASSGLAAPRRVNLDPGILSLSRLILASTKDHSHRIPIRSGIYAEVTLIYTGGDFQPLPWTFPDYRTEGYRAILRDIRSILHDQLRRRA